MREQVPELQIDKSAWGDGPWQTEPDRVQWVHAGYACLMVRNDRMGNWCAYVGVDREHPHYGKGYNECEDVEVHGGLTYAAACQGAICHVPAPGMPADVWWLGFDAAHYRDLAPAHAAYERTIPAFVELNKRKRELEIECPALREVYRDLAYMKRETERLAEQLREKAVAQR